MGGMGRTRNGSYAEYVCAPLTNVFPLKTPLDWAEFAAIPEVYAAAWSCLYGNLRIKNGDVLFVRGGTSSLGQAAINIAKHAGLTVLTSTRSGDKVGLLKGLGATQALIENGALSETMRSLYPDGIDGVLDLVGNSTLLDSLKMVRKDGAVCIAGFLGGGTPIVFDPLTQMPSSINLSFFASFMLGTPHFPLSSIPMQDIIERVADGSYKAKPVKVFNFEQIADAHRLMESSNANGKIVVLCA